MVIRKWLFDHNSPSAGAGRPDETVWRVPPYKQMRHGTDTKKKTLWWYISVEVSLPVC